MTEDKNALQFIIAAAASEKKAQDILILDMQKIFYITDYFVICSANSTTQVRAIADNIEERMRQAGSKLLHREGYSQAHWILLDFGSIIVHVFVNEDRVFYNLERLWGDAPSEYYHEASL